MCKLLPLVVPTDTDFDAFAETTPFRQVARTIAALSTQDERLAEEFRVLEEGGESKSQLVEITGDVPVGLSLDIRAFVDAVRTRVWEKVGRANWRTFEEARAFARALKLRSNREWRERAAAGTLAPDIPTNPNAVYATTGWQSWGDWLGSDTGSRWYKKYRPFDEARSFVRGLALRSGSEWRTYTKTAEFPADIPVNALHVYAADWQGMGDWLGTHAVAPRLRRYRDFWAARRYVHQLGLQSQTEWFNWAKTSDRPADIPTAAPAVYAGKGWKGWGDWLGTGTIAVTGRRFGDFFAAREYARALGLRSAKEWRHRVKQGGLPPHIPTNPNVVYRESGWESWGDWLGTGAVSTRSRGYRSFLLAREYARSLGLSGQSSWRAWTTGRAEPSDIPANPDVVYRDRGWVSWGDWLGTGATATRVREYLPFEDARVFARSLALRSASDWRRFSKSGHRPVYVPAKPYVVYEGKWQGWRDWLGTDNAERGASMSVGAAASQESMKSGSG